MAHEIMGNRFMARKVPAWHALGYVVDDLSSATDALHAIDESEGGSIVIDKLPYQVNVPGVGYWTPDDRYVLVRRPTRDDPTPRNFGEVGPQYTLLQNDQIANIVDMLIDGSKGRWTLDTIGILRNGESIFFALKDIEGFEVAGDDFRQYVTFSDQRNGGQSADIMISDVRTVCANTFRMNLDKNNGRITIRHHSDLLTELSWRVDVIARAIQNGVSMRNAIQGLVKIDVSLDMLNAMLDELFPLPKAPMTIELKASGIESLVGRATTAEYQYMNRIERINRSKDDIRQNFEYLESKYGATGYTAMNALTGWIDHQSGKNTDNGLRVMSERTMSAQMDDLRTKFYGMLQNSSKYAPSKSRKSRG